MEKRERLNDLNELATIRDRSLKLAAFHGYGLSRLALGGNIAHSPPESALTFLNNTAYALGQCAVWEPRYYPGTFGAYNMNAIRHKPV
ncbi:MAG: hypothetical protein ACQESR_30990 [Planctomycetota bacterium]